LKRGRKRLLTVLGVGALTGLGVAMLAFVFWPGPRFDTGKVLAVRFDEHAVERNWPDAPPPSSAAPARADSPRVPVYDDLPHRARRRAGWAHERAAWTGGGWVLCDLSSIPQALDTEEDPGTLASLVPDERGYLGDIDPATSHMVVADGWLPLSVRQPQGHAHMKVGGGLFTAREPVLVEVSWSQAQGEVPGTCQVQRLPEPQGATVHVNLVDEDGQEWIPLDRTVQFVGCGRVFSEHTPIVVDAPCDLRVQRRGQVLYSQVTLGPPGHVDPALADADDVVEVDLVVPPAPSAGTLPRFDETLALADVAAFSGSELLSDHLDQVVDDLAAGDLDLVPLQDWAAVAGTGSVTGGISKSWQAWGEADESID